jgi:hypothetical protein
MTVRRRLIVWAIAALLMPAGACDETAATHESPPATATATSTATATATATPSAPNYAVGETVKLTVRNSGGTTLYTEDFQTECAIVTLQKAAGSSWSDITGCALKRLTRTVKIQPGAAEEIQLDPHSFHLVKGAGGLGFGAGAYRIRFGYRLSAEPRGAQPLTAYSSNFTIG